MKSVTYIYDKIAHDYFKKFPNENEYLEKFLALLQKDSKILDVGCGNGFDVKFATKKGFRIIGIDPSKEMIKIARRICPKAEFRNCSMEKMRFSPNSFDGIIAAFSLIHLPKKYVPKVIEKFHKILKKDGIIYMALQSGKSNEIYIKEPLKADEKIFMNIFSYREIEEILKNYGFEVIKKFTRKPECEEEFNFNKLYIIAKKV